MNDATTIPAAASTEEQTCILVLTRKISFDDGIARDEAARRARMALLPPNWSENTHRNA